jgi:predicted transcriptional regulator
MNAARAVRWARRHAGLSQRELAARSGVPQSTIGRIEAGRVDPRLSTLNALLRVCEFDLEVEPLLGIGIDRSQIQERLTLSPAERIAGAGEGARVFDLFGGALAGRATGSR